MKRLRSQMTSLLPHIKIPIPYRLAPRRMLEVYIDCELGRPLCTRSESELKRFFIDKIDDYSTFFDVGAHIGTYSILATHSPEVKVYSFEPHPDNVDRIKENVNLNNVQNRVKVVPSVVGNSLEEVSLTVAETGSHHSIVETSENQISVNSTTLDAYCDKTKVYPDLVKVDIEGAGHLLVEGASQTLEAHPDWLVEIHSDEEEVAFKNAFESKGYTIHELKKELPGHERDHWFVTIN